MTPLMQQRSAVMGRRFAVVLILVLAVGCALALSARKLQSLQQLLGYHTTIKTNLQAMQANTSELARQTAAFSALLSAEGERTSAELRLYRTVDRIRESLKPIDLQVTPVETKEGVSSVAITLKLPLAAYSEVINAMGRLQAETLPLVVFRSAAFNAAPGTDFTVEGTVLLPVLTETQP